MSECLYQLQEVSRRLRNQYTPADLIKNNAGFLLTDSRIKIACLNIEINLLAIDAEIARLIGVEERIELK